MENTFLGFGDTELRFVRYISHDEIGNSWSYNPAGGWENFTKKYKWPVLIPPNEARQEKTFTNFDFTLMTRAEIDFLWKLSNGYWPYKNDVGFFKHADKNTLFYRDDLKDKFLNFMNYAPSESELLQKNTQWTVEEKGWELGKGLLELPEEFSNNIRPEQFVLSYYVKNGKRGFERKNPTTLANPVDPNTYKVGNIDEFIIEGYDKSITDTNHIFYRKMIPIRELVFYIRVKYGISSALFIPHANDALTQEKFYEVDIFTEKMYIPVFTRYNSQFIDINQDDFGGIGQPFGQEAGGISYVLNQIYVSKKLYPFVSEESREAAGDSNTNLINAGLGLTGVGTSTDGGQSLSEQAFLTSNQQMELLRPAMEPPIFGSGQPDRTNAIKELVWAVYRGLNVQKLRAHWRACKMLDEINIWSAACIRGVENGDIVLVQGEVSKRGEETGHLTPEEHATKDNFTLPTILAIKTKEKSEDRKSVHFISNIPYDVEQRGTVTGDGRYHRRSWNTGGGVYPGEPLFVRPSLSSDYLEDICDLEKTYFMRNLIRPEIEKYLNPYFYENYADKDETAVLLTTIELSKRFAKEYPLVDTETSQQDYDTIKSFSTNIRTDGTKIIEMAATDPFYEKTAVHEYLKSASFPYKVYSAKKNANDYIQSTVAVSAISAWGIHAIEHSIEHAANLAVGGKIGANAVTGTLQGWQRQQQLVRFSRFFGARTYTQTMGIIHNLGTAHHAIHAFESAFEIAAVTFKIFAAINQIILYNDRAAWFSLVKEVVVNGGGALGNIFTKGKLATSVLGGSVSTAGLLWTGIIIGISYYVDAVLNNVRASDKRKKFHKLIDEAHKNGWIEGVYAETGGDIRISKKEAIELGLRVKTDGTKIDDANMNTSKDLKSGFINSNEELMGTKGNEYFWKRISKNAEECKVLLEIAKKNTETDRTTLQKRYNPLLNTAPNISDYGIFTTNEDYSIDPRNSGNVGDRSRANRDRYYPFIHAKVQVNNPSIVKPKFKYTRAAIGESENLVPYFNGTKPSSEFWASGTSNNPTTWIPSAGFNKITINAAKISDKEKVWLIRKKYGLDRINEKAGNNCCDPKPIINGEVSDDILNRVKAENKQLSNQKFLTGEASVIPGATTQFLVGCEYLVDLASEEVIKKLEEICSGKKSVPNNNKKGKKLSKPRSTSQTVPAATYTPTMDAVVINKINVEYITQTDQAIKQLDASRRRPDGGPGVRDTVSTDSPAPRFSRKADLTEFGLQTGPVSTNSISRYLAEFATMDIRSDVRLAINVIASLWAMSHSSMPDDPQDIAQGGLDAPRIPVITIEPSTVIDTEGPVLDIPTGGGGGAIIDQTTVPSSYEPPRIYSPRKG